ncbi:hypothetical protein HK405_008951 [Cladochytrium tenue]|nr:hypothetical protein HK405_008951 [Cladochytrium tenue]
MFTKHQLARDHAVDTVGDVMPPAAILAAAATATAHAAKNAEPLPLPPPPDLPHPPALQHAGVPPRPPHHARSKSHSHSPDHAGTASHHARLPRLGRTSWRPFQCTVDLDLVEFGAVPAPDGIASATTSSLWPALRIKGRITLHIPRRVHDAAAVMICLSGEHWTDEAYIRGLVDHPPPSLSPSPQPQPLQPPPSPAVEFLKYEKVLWRRSQPTSFLPSGRNVFEFDEVVAATAPDVPLLPSVVLPQFAVDYQLSASIVRVLPDDGFGNAGDSAAGAANFDLARTAKALLGMSHAHPASLKTFLSDGAFTDNLLRDPSLFEVWLFNIPIHVPAKNLASAPLFLPDVRIDRPVTSTSKARPGIKIARGTSTFGLFDYELTMPKLVCMDQDRVNLILQLRPSAPSQTVTAVPLVGCSLVEKRIYNLAPTVANHHGTYPSVVRDSQEHREERPYEANFVAPSSASSKSASQSSLKSLLSGRNGKKKPSFSIQTSKIRSFSSSGPKSPLPSARPPSREAALAKEGYGNGSDVTDTSLFKRSMSLTRAPSRNSDLSPEPDDGRPPNAPTGQAHVAFYPEKQSVHGDEVTIVESFTLGPEIEYTLEASQAQIISKAVHLSPGPTPLRWKLFPPPLRPIRGSFSDKDGLAKGANVGEGAPSPQRVVSRSPVSKMRSYSNPNFALTLHGEETGLGRGSTLRKASSPTLKEMLTRTPSVLRPASADSDRDRSRSPSLRGIGGAVSSIIDMRDNNVHNDDAPATDQVHVGSRLLTSSSSPTRAGTAIPRGASPAGAAPIHSYSSASLVANPLPHEHLFILSFQPHLHASTTEPRLPTAPTPKSPSASTPLAGKVEGEDADDQAFSLASFLQTAPPPRQSDVAAKGLTGSVGVGHAGVDHPGTASIMPDIKGFRGFEVSHSVLIRVWFAPVAGLGGSGDQVARPVGHRETALACLGGVADVSVRPATGTFAARTFREDWIEVPIPVYSSL